MMELLQSLQNPKLKEIVRLISRSREVRKQGKTVLEGAHLLESALQHDQALSFGVISSSAEQNPEIMALVRQSQEQHTPWVKVEDRLFERLSDTVTPQGVLAVMEIPKHHEVDRGHDFVLVLEDIQDPGNLGTLIRSAVATGVDAVVVSKGSAEPWSPKVLRSGMGAHFSIKVLHSESVIDFVAGWSGVAATTLSGDSAWTTDWSSLRGLAIGNEGAGLSEGLQAVCDRSITLPMSPGVESLNAAVAGSVLLFERRRVLKPD